MSNVRQYVNEKSRKTTHNQNGFMGRVANNRTDRQTRTIPYPFILDNAQIITRL